MKGCDIQKFWMCTASSVRQWGLSVKEKYGNFFESPGKDPRVEWAACCNSEVPLFGGAGAEAGLRMLLEAPQLWVEHCMSWAAVLFFTARGFDADMFTTHSWTILANTALDFLNSSYACQIRITGFCFTIKENFLVR